MKIILSFLLLTFTVPAFARSSEIREIFQVTDEIRELAEESNLDDRELRSALRRLHEARDILLSERRPGGVGACFEYAYARFVKTYGEGANSVNEATKLCRSVEDVRVLAFFYERYAKTYGEGANSLIQAAAHTGFRGKLDLMSFLYSKYARTYGEGAVALQQAVNSAQSLNRRSLSCLESVYPKMARTYGEGAVALQQSIQSCANL